MFLRQKRRKTNLNHRVHRVTQGTAWKKVKNVPLEELNKVSGEVVDASMEVHSALGPGLLETVYEQCLALELSTRGLKVEKQIPIPALYKDTRLEVGFRLDLLVEDSLIVELKEVEKVLSIHEAHPYLYETYGMPRWLAA